MVWAKIDDEILDNPKIARAGVLGFALHVAAITWCCRTLSDGFIPYARVRLLLDLSDLGIEYIDAADCPRGAHDRFFDVLFDVGQAKADAIALRLVNAGLWLEDKERGGYWIHDFLEYNPSREEAEANRETRSAAGKRGAAARWANRPAGDGSSHGKRMASAMANGWQNDAPIPIPVPDPIKSVTLIQPGASYARAREVPERPSGIQAVSWTLDSTMPAAWRDGAKARLEESGETVDVDAEWAKYLADRLRPDQVKRIGPEDWRGWVLKAIGFAKRERMRESDWKQAAEARRAKPPGASYAKETPEQAREFAKQLAARLGKVVNR